MSANGNLELQVRLAPQSVPKVVRTKRRSLEIHLIFIYSRTFTVRLTPRTPVSRTITIELIPHSQATVCSYLSPVIEIMHVSGASIISTLNNTETRVINSPLVEENEVDVESLHRALISSTIILPSS